MSAQAYWNQRYSESPFQSGKTPLSFLVDMYPRLQKGRALDIAMGEGQNAVFLAQKGMQVKGFDISPTAVDHANRLAQESGVSIEAKTADLDLYLLGLMEYDTIVMTYFKPPVARYYSEMIRALKQGGTLLIHSYTTEEMTETLSQDEAHRNYFYRCNELIQQLRDLQILFYNEAEMNGKHVVQCLARKPLDKDVAKYNLFNMHTPQENKAKETQKDLAEALFKKK